MKIRNGFVSNSSSSSFVLIFNKDHFQKIIYMIEEVSKNTNNTLTSIDQANKQEFLEWCTNFSTKIIKIPNRLKERFDRLNNTEEVMQISIDHRDEYLSLYLEPYCEIYGEEYL